MIVVEAMLQSTIRFEDSLLRREGSARLQCMYGPVAMNFLDF